MNYIGIEIGGTKLQVVTGTAAGQIDQRKRFSIDQRAGAEGIRSQIESSLAELLSAGQYSGVGCGFGGPIILGQGRVAKSHQVGGWDEFPLQKWLNELTDLPCRVENDANTAAFAEAMVGSGKSEREVLYVTLGSGVGGGFVVNRQIYHGATPGEVEIGHLRLAPFGPIVEAQCSGWAVDQALRRAADANPKSWLAGKARQPDFGARYLLAAIEAGDRSAITIWKDLIANLSFALSHAIHLLHPAIIVLGGGLSLIGSRLADEIQQAIPAQIMEVFRPGPKVTIAALAEDVVPVGALLLAAQAARERH
jgi:glucokinase